jgi:hypothetical protein
MKTVQALEFHVATAENPQPLDGLLNRSAGPVRSAHSKAWRYFGANRTLPQKVMNGHVHDLCKLHQLGARRATFPLLNSDDGGASDP